ncbi:tfa2 [Candida pseudojiufengensis]|uniref:tfa2 n=1 Tax=Candida pseudojiufengensis TaxID=497109 RepID=UPI002225A7A8|nr:tfa2 [Candida pseudojiufengensis]KAI5963794.1 tfa2 [Candida pseudojiufengensis]
MSNLSAQLSAFKNKIKSGPSVAVARKPIVKPSSPSNESPNKPSNNESSNNTIKRSTTSTDSTPERKRPRIPTTQEMNGAHLSTQLHLAVEFIKEQDQPVSIYKLQDHLSIDVQRSLLPLLKEIDRVKFNSSNNTFTYVSLHNIKNSDDLLEFLRKQTTFKGTSVKELKDGWTGCLAAIDELEEENKILVLRNKKENAPRLVWANAGGKIGEITDEFKKQWNDTKLPEPDILYQSLIDQGLKPTGADPSLINKKPQQQEKKQKKARRGKITNTHMKGILKDYSQLM